MKTRPHIVTQTCVIDTGSLERAAGLMAERMGRGERLEVMLRISNLLIWAMKTILSLTERNTCFTRRQEVRSEPKLRRRVFETLGGAPAMEKWRRQNTWNTARLAAIASGEYIPPATGYDEAPRLCTMLWPHELDGQYVPNFKSRARIPGGEYGTYANAAYTRYAGQKIAGAPP